ncbi:MAG: FHA domain-containing protein [Fuerstiella sp.]
MKVILELKKGNTKAKRINVRQDVVIGRGSECSLRLPSSQVSRKHCSVTFKDDVVYVMDLGSSNGTWLNGVKLPANQAFEVGSTMKLALGPIKFLIHVVKDAPSQQSTSSQGQDSEITSISLAPPVPVVPVAAAPVAARVAGSALADDTAVEDVSIDAAAIIRQNREPSPQANTAADSPAQDAATANDSIGRLQPIAKNDADAVQDATTGNSMSDAGILQFGESMLVEQDDGNFQLPSIDEVDSEEDVDEIQMIEAFDIVEVVDPPAVVDDIQVIEEPEALHDVEVLDDIEVLDEIEVIQDIQVLDDIEVLDDVQVLDQVDVLDDFDDVEVLDD